MCCSPARHARGVVRRHNREHENAFYACLLFISGGAIGALLQSIYFSLRVSRTRADPHIFVDRNLGSGIGCSGVEDPIYLPSALILLLG